MTNLSQATVLEDIAEHEGNLVVLFHDPINCRPCKSFHPHYTAAAKNLPDVDFLEVDINENIEIAAAYGVMSVPKAIAFVGDNEAFELHSRTVLSLVKEINSVL